MVLLFTCSVQPSHRASLAGIGRRGQPTGVSIAGPPTGPGVLARSLDSDGPAPDRSPSHIDGPRTISVHARRTDASRRTKAELCPCRGSGSALPNSGSTSASRTRWLTVGQVSGRRTGGPDCSHGPSYGGDHVTGEETIQLVRRRCSLKHRRAVGCCRLSCLPLASGHESQESDTFARNPQLGQPTPHRRDRATSRTSRCSLRTERHRRGQEAVGVHSRRTPTAACPRTARTSRGTPP